MYFQFYKKKVMEIDGVSFTVLWKYLYRLHYTLQRFMVEYFKVCMYILQQYKLNKNIWSGDTNLERHTEMHKHIKTYPWGPLGIWPKSLCVKRCTEGIKLSHLFEFTKHDLAFSTQMRPLVPSAPYSQQKWCIFELNYPHLTDCLHYPSPLPNLRCKAKL